MPVTSPGKCRVGRIDTDEFYHMLFATDSCGLFPVLLVQIMLRVEPRGSVHDSFFSVDSGGINAAPTGFETTDGNSSIAPTFC